MTGSEARVAVATVGLNQRIGRFRVVRRLARGQGADVFLCEDDDGGRVVLRVERAPFEGSLAEVGAAALAHRRLRHPSIARLFGVFAVDGRLVVASEYVEGTSLNVLMTALRQNGLTLAPAAALHVAARIFAGIASAHAQTPEPVVLGHLRPSLALVAWDGEVKLHTYEPESREDARRSGVEWTVHRYLAPEQQRGEGPTMRSDVYAAALMTRELLARAGGASPEAWLAGDEAIEALDSSLDTALREGLRMALEPTVDRRVATAPLLAAVLRSAADALHGRGNLVETLSFLRRLAGDAPPSSREPSRSMTTGEYRIFTPRGE